MNPALLTEKKTPLPVLIVDKVGVIGETLSIQLSGEALVVFVSQKQVYKNNIIHIPYKNKFPLIPDNPYSHVFVVDDDIFSTRDALPSFLKKAKDENIPFTYIANIYEIKKGLIDLIFDNYKKSKVALYGDVVCKNSSFFSNNLNYIIHKMNKSGKICLPGSGLEPLYPATFNDLISGIMEVAFGTDLENKIYNMFPNHEITMLSFAKAFLAQNPNLKLDFSKENKNKQAPLIYRQAKFIFPEDTLNKIAIENSHSGKQEINEISNQVTNKKYKNKKMFPVMLASTVVLILVLPVLFTAFFSYLGLRSLTDSIRNIEKGEVSAAYRNTFLAEKSFTIAKKTEPLLRFQAKVLNQENKLNLFLENINRGEKGSEGIRSFVLALNSYRVLLAGTSKNATEDFRSGHLNLKDFLIFLQREKLENSEISATIQKYPELFTFASSSIDVLPDFLGLMGKRKYLVLFQNNMELRPGGGFIGSYAVLNVENGKLEELKIHDVYDADGLLKGHVEPPFQIRRYLEVPHLYMRDSNFDVDFSKAASKVAFMYALETGEKVDGVIAIDLGMLKKLLEATGPIYVPDYKETVTPENFFLITESHVEKNFFPGSTQKKDFLRSLFNSMVLRLEQGNNISYTKLIKAFNDSLPEKHLLFSFNNSSIQNLFVANNWTSSLWDSRKIEDDTVLDFLGISEANLGANKANYFISRSMSQKVKIDTNGKISEETELVLKNNSNVWPGGDYVNYVRFILPANSNLSEIKISGVKQNIISAITDYRKYEAKNFKPPVGLEVEKTSQEGKDVIGFLITVPSKKSISVNVSYSLNQKINLKKSKFIYSQKLFKQPGVDMYPFVFTFQAPAGYEITSGTNGISNNLTSAVLASDLNKDKIINLNIAKK
ncbi:DUF4012 domain-containing protein [Patescibacteria group bacterium]|nr:DUF4012 domain-containing protein [Patescibacteria group bacterium]